MKKLKAINKKTGKEYGVVSAHADLLTLELIELTLDDGSDTLCEISDKQLDDWTLEEVEE